MCFLSCRTKLHTCKYWEMVWTWASTLGEPWMLQYLLLLLECFSSCLTCERKSSVQIWVNRVSREGIYFCMAIEENGRIQNWFTWWCTDYKTWVFFLLWRCWMISYLFSYLLQVARFWEKHVLGQHCRRRSCLSSPLDITILAVENKNLFTGSSQFPSFWDFSPHSFQPCHLPSLCLCYQR